MLKNYTYDFVGRRNEETREDGNLRNFNYDPVDRVLAAVSSEPSVVNSESFAYDLTGNWTVNSRQHDADNKLIGDANHNYQYDVEGNLTQKASTTNPADVTNYAYDAENRLVQLTVGSPVTATISYQYDALGRRVAKTVNGVTTRYVLDGSNVRLELNGSNQVVAANTESGLDQLLVRDSSTGTDFVHTDGLGSTTTLTDSSGNVIERYRYSSFGQLQVLNPDYTLASRLSPRIPNTYTGREWDSDAGIYFYRARFYSPFMGRFLSQDPLGYYGGDNNYYAYVGGDPINYFDPTGEVRWGALGSASLGLVTNGIGLVTAGLLAITPEPTGATKVAAVVVGLKSSYGLGANGQNFYDALTDQDPISKGTLANDVAQAVAPGSVNAQRVATIADLATDLATGRIANNLAASSNTVETVARDAYGMPVYNPLYEALKDPGYLGAAGDAFTLAALGENIYNDVYGPLATDYIHKKPCGN